MNNSSIVIVATKGSPKVKAHVNGVIIAEISVGDNGRARNPVALHGNGLAAE